jgi:iron complex transport system permease protein
MITWMHMKRNNIIPLLILLLFFSILCGLKFGYITFTDKVIFQQLLEYVFDHGATSGEADILLNLRLPRTVLAVCAGMGLAVSGVVMQAVLGNPLADPYVLGLSAGASFGAVCAIFFGLGTAFGAQSIGGCAFIGAFIAAIGVLLLAASSDHLNVSRLLLSGMALNGVFSGASMFIVFIGSNKDGMQSISYWMLGNISNADWDHVIILCWVILLGTLFFVSQFRSLNLLLSGGKSAVTMGVDLRKCSLLYLLVCTLMVGFIVYNAGIIGFMGLVVPHICRSIFGADHRYLVPVTAILGGIFGVWADILGRSLIAGIEIPFGVMLAFLGGPFFLYLVAIKSYAFGGNI